MPLTITKPTVGASDGAWGGMLNTLFDAVKTFVDKLEASRGRVDVKADGGAAVDGTTDDWPIVRALLAAGGDVFLPPGTHYWKLTSSTQTVPAGTTITGVPGKTVVILDTDTPAAQREFIRQSGDELTIRGVEFRRGSAFGLIFFPLAAQAGFTMTDCVLDGRTATYGSILGAHGFRLGTAAGTTSRVRVRNCVIKGMYFALFQDNASTGATKDIRFTECLFDGNIEDLEFNGPNGPISNVRVTRCTFQNSTSASTSEGFAVGAATVTDLQIVGCTATGYFNEAFHVEDYCRSVKILNNEIVDCSTGATQWLVILSGSRGIEIKGNTFRQVGTVNPSAAIAVLQGGSGTTPSGGTFAPPSDIDIEGNTIDVSSTTNGIYLDTPVDVRVVGNRIRSTGTVSSFYSGPNTYAITASGAGTGFVFERNKVKGFKWGILPQNGSTVNLGTGFVVQGNHFRDCYLGISGQNLGTGSIRGNDFLNCESSITASYESAVVGNVAITDNHAVGCTNPMGIYGYAIVFASAARATGSGVTMNVYGIPNALPAGSVLYFDGGGVFTTTAFAAMGATAIVGNLVTAAVGNGEQGLAYWPWSSSSSKAATIAGNSDDVLGADGYGHHVVESGTAYRVRGHEAVVSCWAAGTKTLEPAANCRGRVHAFANTTGSTVTIASAGGAVVGGGTYGLPAGAQVRVVSTGTQWIAT